MCGCKSNIIGDKCDKCIDGFFGFPNCQSKWFLFSIFHAFPHQINHFQAAIVKMRDQRVWHVTKEMESATTSQTFLVTSVKNVWMDSLGFQIVTDVLVDSMDFQTVNVGFSSFFFVICLRYFRGNGNSLNLQGIRKKSQPHDFLTPNFFLLSYQIVWRIISSSSLLVDIFFKILLLNKNIKNNFLYFAFG